MAQRIDKQHPSSESTWKVDLIESKTDKAAELNLVTPRNVTDKTVVLDFWPRQCYYKNGLSLRKLKKTNSLAKLYSKFCEFFKRQKLFGNSPGRTVS